MRVVGAVMWRVRSDSLNWKDEIQGERVAF